MFQFFDPQFNRVIRPLVVPEGDHQIIVHALIAI